MNAPKVNDPTRLSTVEMASLLMVPVKEINVVVVAEEKTEPPLVDLPAEIALQMLIEEMATEFVVDHERRICSLHRRHPGLAARYHAAVFALTDEKKRYVQSGFSPKDLPLNLQEILDKDAENQEKAPLG